MPNRAKRRTLAHRFLFICLLHNEQQLRQATIRHPRRASSLMVVVVSKFASQVYAFAYEKCIWSSLFDRVRVQWTLHTVVTYVLTLSRPPCGHYSSLLLRCLTVMQSHWAPPSPESGDQMCMRIITMYSCQGTYKQFSLIITRAVCNYSRNAYAYQMFCVLAVYFDKYIVNSRVTVIAVCVCVVALLPKCCWRQPRKC